MESSRLVGMEAEGMKCLLTGSIFQSVRSQLPLPQGLGPDLWLAQACAVTHCGCVFRVNSLVLTGSTFPVSSHTHDIICERKLSLCVSALILAATPAGIVQHHSLTEVRAPSVKIAGVQQTTDSGSFSQSTEQSVAMERDGLARNQDCFLKGPDLPSL